MISCVGTCKKTAGLAVCILLLTACLSGKAVAQGTNAPGDADEKSAEQAVVEGHQTVRSLLEIQEQIHSTQMAIEKNRQESEASSENTAQILEARLSRLEKSIANQRYDELKQIEHADHMMLVAAGCFAGVGFLVLLVSAWLQWSGVNRLAAVTASLPNYQSLQSLNLGDGGIGVSKAVEQSNALLMGLLDRLDKRLSVIEEGAAPASKQLALANENGHHETGALEVSNGNLPHSSEENGAAYVPEVQSPVALLLGKGQTLLKLDKAEEALECLDEVLEIDPANTDALIKKGAALERLQKLPEAIACYDLALSHDNSITIAYLYKGSVFNRMEKYGEALECYEKALKSRNGTVKAENVIFD